jgi:hypothetical protein
MGVEFDYTFRLRQPDRGGGKGGIREQTQDVLYNQSIGKYPYDQEFRLP